MRSDFAPALFGAPVAQRVELVLYRDGSPWVLSVAPGVERFIGRYPRVEGIDAGAPLLQYLIVHAAG